MGKERIQKARAKYLLFLQIEENERKSPDILTAVVTAKTSMEAYGIAGIFEEASGEDLPFPLDEWRLTVKSPTELYCV